MRNTLTLLTIPPISGSLCSGVTPEYGLAGVPCRVALMPSVSPLWAQQFQRQLADVAQQIPPGADDSVSEDQSSSSDTQDDTEAAWSLATACSSVAGLLPPATDPGPTVTGQLSPQLATLIEQHVTQWLISADARETGESGQVILQLGEHLLAGAQLTLVRQPGGWALKAHTDSRTLLAIRRAERQLVQHFHQSGLGKLSVEASGTDAVAQC